jgi:salicylate hydroxylase
MPFKIVIVGTGIAGLSSAIALSDKGHSVTVVEAATKLQPIGGTIVIQANANRVLDRLGVYQSLLPICGTTPLPLRAKRYQDGDILMSRQPTDHERDFGYP